jgi:adenylate kinase family enzyme
MVDAPYVGRRICVIGNAATGKSTLARVLADRLGLRYIDRDALVWDTGWRQRSREELFGRVEAATREDGWAYDGHLRRRRPYEQVVLGRCDTIVWLDFSRWRVMWSVLRRTLRRLLTHEELSNGNVETWRMAFLPDWSIGWAWRNHVRLRVEYEALFASPQYVSKIRVRLRNHHEVNQWLSRVPAACQQSRC